MLKTVEMLTAKQKEYEAINKKLSFDLEDTTKKLEEKESEVKITLQENKE